MGKTKRPIVNSGYCQMCEKHYAVHSFINRDPKNYAACPVDGTLLELSDKPLDSFPEDVRGGWANHTRRR